MELNWVELVGYGGTAATILTYSMRTIVPLRIAGIASSFFFIAYASLTSVWPMLATELVILPLNSFRLYQILKLMRQIRQSADGDYLADWLLPFASERSFSAGEIIFGKGDAAHYLLLLRTGRYRLVERGIEMGPGELVGEIGFISPEHRRTLTLQCIEAGSAGAVSYSDLKQLYFQNPRFAYYLLQLLGTRLVEKLEQARSETAQELPLPVPAGPVADRPPGVMLQ